MQLRQTELDLERQITALPPVLQGAALILPAGALAAPQRGNADGFSEDPEARAIIEKLAMEAVMGNERELGHEPRDISSENKGYDIESRDGTTGHLRFIEVKGRHSAAREVILTKNEILAALNAPEAYFLAVVKVEDGFAGVPTYVQNFVEREPGWNEVGVIFNLARLLAAPA